MTTAGRGLRQPRIRRAGETSDDHSIDGDDDDDDDSIEINGSGNDDDDRRGRAKRRADVDFLIRQSRSAEKPSKASKRDEALMGKMDAMVEAISKSTTGIARFSVTSSRSHLCLVFRSRNHEFCPWPRGAWDEARSFRIQRSRSQKEVRHFRCSAERLQRRTGRFNV